MSRSIRRNRLGHSLIATAALLAACGRSSLVPTHGWDGSANGGAPQGHPWPMFGHDPRGSRCSSADTSGNTGKLKWRFNMGVPIYSTPAIAEDGTIYVFSGDEILYAISPPETGNTGVLKWSYSVRTVPADLLAGASPALGPDGTVYVVSPDKLYAISPPATGTEGLLKWTYQVPSDWGVSSPVIGADGTIYVVGSELCALSAVPSGTNGVLKWSYDPVVPFPPAIADDGSVYAMGDSFRLVGISPPAQGSRGSLKCSFPEPFVYAPSIISRDGTVFASYFQDVHAFTPPSVGSVGVEAWSCPLGCSIVGLYAIGSDGTAYFQCEDGEDRDLLAVAPPREGRTGVLKWKWSRHAISTAPAVGADGTVYLGATDGKIYAIGPAKSGTNAVEKWSFQTQGPVFSSPSIGADGTIYIGSYDGYLYAIQ